MGAGNQRGDPISRTRLHPGRSNLATRDFPKRRIKLALLLVRQMNPMEELTMVEQAILVGLSKDRMTNIRAEKRLVQVVSR
jgi:hypothetical protein